METGLLIRYRNDNDGLAISNILDTWGYYYEWKGRMFFLEEEIENYDLLEEDINKVIPNTINFWIEPV
jgi:hypothetical protein